MVLPDEVVKFKFKRVKQYLNCKQQCAVRVRVLAISYRHLVECGVTWLPTTTVRHFLLLGAMAFLSQRSLLLSEAGSAAADVAPPAAELISVAVMCVLLDEVLLPDEV